MTAKPYEPGWRSDERLVAEALCCGEHACKAEDCAAAGCESRCYAPAYANRAAQAVAMLRRHKRLLVTPSRLPCTST